MPRKDILITTYKAKIESETNIELPQRGDVFFLFHCSTRRKPQIQVVLGKNTV